MIEINVPQDATLEEITALIQSSLDAMQKEIEDEMTETLGRPLAKAVLWAMDKIADVHIYVERKLGR